jgi:hypothetical protein
MILELGAVFVDKRWFTLRIASFLGELESFPLLEGWTELEGPMMIR